MGFCSKCGAPCADGVQFCPSCGAPIANANQSANPQQPQQPPQQPGFNGAPQYNQQPPQQGYAPQYGYQGAPNYSQPNPAVAQPNAIHFLQRNIAVAIILSILTCGLYGIYWLIKMADEINEASGEVSATSGATVFLLSIITCGIYLFFWLYKAGERLNRAKGMRGMPVDSNSGVIYLVLAIFGLWIVSYAMIQSELNKIAAFHGAPPV